MAVAALAMGALPAYAQGQSKNDVYGTDGQVKQVRRAPGIEDIEGGLIVTPRSNDAAVVRVEVVAKGIVRVSADPEGQFVRDESLIVTDFPARPEYNVRKGRNVASLSTEGLRVEISRADGKVRFLDGDGNELLAEDRRVMTPKMVQGEQFYSVQQAWQPVGEPGFYGLGQHQNGQMNMAGETVELAQHNISIAMPFVASTGDYGILWDNASITRFGDPRPFQPLDETLIVRGEDGSEGGLTGRYYDENGKVQAETRERDPDYQFLPPDQYASGEAVRDVFPEPFGTESPEKVVWTGGLEAKTTGTHKFRAYGSSYLTIKVDGETVVDRWRQNWNPYYFTFDVDMVAGESKDIEIEWIANDGYFRLEHLDPLPAEQQDDLSFASDVAQVIDYYFVAADGDKIDDVIAGYRTLTGESVMLPKWAYGFWQSRQRYTTQDELLDALKGYRDRKIPIDNIVLDWFYWPEKEWGSHKFDLERFPDAAAMVDAVHEMNARIMISVWPKFYPTTANAKALEEIGAIYQRQLMMDTRDWVGQGYRNSFYDPYSAEARELFWSQMKEALDSKGFDAWWMDAVEPDLHSNLSHRERALRIGPTAMGPGAQYFNSFALVNAQAVYEGEREGSDPNERVFILTRSAFPGIQRYGVSAWSGDVVARWEDLKEQVAAGVNFSMSGVPNWTFDIGGFAVEQRYTDEDPAHIEEWRELNTRWFQLGAFTPLFRSHGEFPFREIYNLAPEGSDPYESMVYYDKLRYRLMPFIYTLAADTTLKDGSMMRGLVMDFEDDKKVWDINDQYLFGSSFLVAPVYEFKARERDVYLPAGSGWYDFESGEHFDGGQTVTADAPLARMPLYVREGSIVPMGPDIQSTADDTNGELTIYVYTGADASFSLYEDDGLTYDYEDEAYVRIPMTWSEETGTLTIGAVEGELQSMPEERVIHVRFVSPDGDDGFAMDAEPDSTITYTGAAVDVSME
ncbi:TIM-barrel domain-containing protein [Parvularcula sp. LCG005]|uniref:glycoside hydrolase family 31 protein n=1 Tax=Parvularcula sp. LCG005 TaxID=3078805 RepID=UPI003979AA77